MPAHLTLFHHLPPSLEPELAARLAEATRAPPPLAAIVGIMALGEGTALRVESGALEAVRADLADAFHGLMTPQDQAPWRPHVTVQNKVARTAARDLQARLATIPLPRPLVIRALALWRYLGGPWAPVRSWPYRR